MPARLLAVLGIAAVALVGVTVWSARERAPELRVIAAVPEARGLRVGTRVDYRGIEIGAVRQVAFTESTVVLTIHLTRADVPLRSTDRIDVRPVGLFGDVAVTIVPGSHVGRAWRAGDTLRAVPTDTLASARQAAVRALVDAALSRVLAPDSGRDAPASTSGP